MALDPQTAWSVGRDSYLPLVDDFRAIKDRSVTPNILRWQYAPAGILSYADALILDETGKLVVQRLVDLNFLSILGSSGVAGQAVLSNGPGFPIGWGSPSAGNVVTTVATTGNIDDLNFAGANVLVFNNAALATLRGLAAGVNGQTLLVLSVGAGQVDLAHQNAGSAAANRLFNHATSAPSSLAAGAGWALFVYDTTISRWRMLGHDQGAELTATYNAANFTSSGTWGVDAGDVTTLAYVLRGKVLDVFFTLDSTSVSGTAGLFLNILNGAWGGFTAAKTVYGSMGFVFDNGVSFPGCYCRNTGGTSIDIGKGDISNWSNASVNNTIVRGFIRFPVV